MAEKFNAGDPVYIYSFGYQVLRKGVIARVTKTQAIIQHEGYEERFNRDTGRLIGGGLWDSSSLSHPTERLDREWHERKIRNARSALRKAAEKDDATAIRKAFALWDRLEASDV